MLFCIHLHSNFRIIRHVFLCSFSPLPSSLNLKPLKKTAALCHKVSPLFATASLEEEQLVSPESISPEMAIDPMKTHLTETLTHWKAHQNQTGLLYVLPCSPKAQHDEGIPVPHPKLIKRSKPVLASITLRLSNIPVLCWTVTAASELAILE